MRKKAALVTAVMAAATIAFCADTVTSVNVVGYLKKELPQAGWIMTACNFDKTGGGTNTLLDVFGTDTLTQDDNLLLCDRVIIWNMGDSAYQTWAQWTDGIFYKANDNAEWGQGLA